MPTSSTVSAGDRLASMYKRWVLDSVITSAYAISKDFSRRPELYQDVDGDTARKLTNLQTRYGYDGEFPSDDQRVTLFKPIFGASDGLPKNDDTAPFFDTRRTVISAATDYSENAQPTGFPMLQERFRSALVPFRTYLRDRAGASLNETDRRHTALFDLAQSVLKQTSIRSVFGINKDLDAAWPLDTPDPNGAKLIEKIALQLTDVASGQISLDRFVRLQRVAQKGADAIAGALTDGLETDAKKLDAVIASFYAWGSDLASVRSDATARSRAASR